MNDTMPMGCAKGVRNLNGVQQHLLQRERPFLEPGGEGLALEVLHHKVVDSVLMADVVQRADMREEP